jgi:hypothetical protein
VNLTPALHLQADQTIKASIVVIVCQNLIAEKPCTLTVDADMAIIGFQKHVGQPVTLNLGKGQLFMDKAGMKNITINKQASVKDFSKLSSANEELNVLVGLLNACFPHEFAGHQGFYVGGEKWE